MNLTWNVDTTNDPEHGTVGIVIRVNGNGFAMSDLFSPADARTFAKVLNDMADNLNPPAPKLPSTRPNPRNTRKVKS